MTGAKLVKISDIYKYLFVEKELKGGISYIAKRYAKANNKYMNDYDSKKLSEFITYLDMNNLYGWGLSEYLPYGGFKWLKNINGFDMISISENSSIGNFLKVDFEYPDELHELHNDYPLAPKNLADLEYPDELHELHNDYPLAPKNLAVLSDMLSKYCKEIADNYS